MQLRRVQPEPPTQLELLFLGEANVLEQLAHLGQVHAGSAFALSKVTARPIHAPHQLVELLDDPVDGTPREADVHHGVEVGALVVRNGPEVGLLRGLVAGVLGHLLPQPLDLLGVPPDLVDLLGEVVQRRLLVGGRGVLRLTPAPSGCRWAPGSE